MQGPEVPIDSVSPFGQMENVDTKHMFSAECSMNNSHDSQSLSDVICSTVSINDEKLPDAETQEERLQQSFRYLAAKTLSIENSADLEMRGTIMFKDKKSSKSVTVNFSDTCCISTHKQCSKRKNRYPVRFGGDAKRFKWQLSESETGTTTSNSPLKAGVFDQEKPVCMNKADISLLKPNEKESLLATSSFCQTIDSQVDQATERTSTSPMIQPKHSFPFDETNKVMAPGTSISESSASLLNHSMRFSLPSFPTLPSINGQLISGNFENAPSLLDLKFGSEWMKLGSHQMPTMAPIQREFLSEAALCNIPAILYPILTNPLSQSLMTSTNTTPIDQVKLDLVKLLRMSTSSQDNRSPNKASDGLLGYNKPMSESKPLFKNQILDSTTRQQPERARRKRGRRPIQYVCNLCNEAFQKVCELNVHTKEMHECYKCHLCNAKFTQRSNLQRHEPIHSGDRPYKCLRCPRDYLRADHLKRHMNRDHPGYDPDRDTLVLSSAPESRTSSKLSESDVLSEESKKDADVFASNQDSFAEGLGSKLGTYSLEVQETEKVIAMPTRETLESSDTQLNPWEQLSFPRCFSIA